MSLDSAKRFLFYVNYSNGLRMKLKEFMPAEAPKSPAERIANATEVANRFGYSFTADELQEAMLEANDPDALELEAITADSGLAENVDDCAAAAESGVWCTAQTSPATVGSTFMYM